MGLMEQWGRVQQRGSYDVWEFENTHGRPDPSRTPDMKYDPKKAMKQAEKEYLASKGIVKKTLWEKIIGLFRHGRK